MMVVICGLIGSGKSTWAAEHYRIVLEHEDFGSKAGQMAAAMALIEQGKDFAYITCYPTLDEQQFFDVCKPDRYVLIDTSEAQARRNILARKRKSDADIVASGFRQNERLANLIYRSRLPFERISLFETDEKW